MYFLSLGRNVRNYKKEPLNQEKITVKKKKKTILAVILIIAIIIIVAAGWGYGKKQKNNPVWNDVQIDQSGQIYVGQDWDTLLQVMEDAGLDSEENVNCVPLKDGKMTGCNIDRDSKGNGVRSVYYEIGDNEAGCAVYLAGIRMDRTTTYSDIVTMAGEEKDKKEYGQKITYYWEEGDKELIIETDRNGVLVAFDIAYL